MGCRCWSAFLIFVMPIRSGGICDQSRKLSKIAPNFGRFCPPKFCWGGHSKCTLFITPTMNQSHGKVSWGYTHYPKVIGSLMLIFKLNFKCSPLNFLGRPRPGLWCALSSLGQILACVKIWGASTPKGRNIVSRKNRLGRVQTHMSQSHIHRNYILQV